MKKRHSEISYIKAISSCLVVQLLLVVVVATNAEDPYHNDTTSTRHLSNATQASKTSVKVPGDDIVLRETSHHETVDQSNPTKEQSHVDVVEPHDVQKVSFNLTVYVDRKSSNGGHDGRPYDVSLFDGHEIIHRGHVPKPHELSEYADELSMASSQNVPVSVRLGQENDGTSNGTAVDLEHRNGSYGRDEFDGRPPDEGSDVLRIASEVLVHLKPKRKDSSITRSEEEEEERSQDRDGKYLSLFKTFHGDKDKDKDKDKITFHDPYHEKIFKFVKSLVEDAAWEQLFMRMVRMVVDEFVDKIITHLFSKHKERSLDDDDIGFVSLADRAVGVPLAILPITQVVRMKRSEAEAGQRVARIEKRFPRFISAVSEMMSEIEGNPDADLQRILGEGTLRNLVATNQVAEQILTETERTNEDPAEEMDPPRSELTNDIAVLNAMVLKRLRDLLSAKLRNGLAGSHNPALIDPETPEDKTDVMQRNTSSDVEIHSGESTSLESRDRDPVSHPQDRSIREMLRTVLGHYTSSYMIAHAIAGNVTNASSDPETSLHDIRDRVHRRFARSLKLRGSHRPLDNLSSDLFQDGTDNGNFVDNHRRRTNKGPASSPDGKLWYDAAPPKPPNQLRRNECSLRSVCNAGRLLSRLPSVHEVTRQLKSPGHEPYWEALLWGMQRKKCSKIMCKRFRVRKGYKYQRRTRPIKKKIRFGRQVVPG